MDKNYYDTLGVTRQSSQQQIADSYRKLALRWHPRLAKQDTTTSTYHFSQVAEAYEVLSDPIKKSFYDKYGWKKLKDGLFQEGGLKGGYRFGDNAEEIFQNFFSSNEIFAQVFDKKINNKGSMFSQAFGALDYENPNKNPDVVVNINCDLSELYRGGSKKIDFVRQQLNPDGRTLSMCTVTKMVEIKPGFSEKTVLRFEGEGNETISKQKSDLICKIVQIPHPNYSRRDNDLIYLAKISLADAFSCSPIQLLTLDNRKLRVGLDEIASPSNMKEVPKEGMPLPNSNKERGSLYIKFDIAFPSRLPEEVRNQIRSLLQ